MVIRETVPGGERDDEQVGVGVLDADNNDVSLCRCRGSDQSYGIDCSKTISMTQGPLNAVWDPSLFVFSQVTVCTSLIFNITENFLLFFCSFSLGFAGKCFQSCTAAKFSTQHAAGLGALKYSRFLYRAVIFGK